MNERTNEREPGLKVSMKLAVWLRYDDDDDSVEKREEQSRAEKEIKKLETFVRFARLSMRRTHV